MVDTESVQPVAQHCIIERREFYDGTHSITEQVIVEGTPPADFNRYVVSGQVQVGTDRDGRPVGLNLQFGFNAPNIIEAFRELPELIKAKAEEAVMQAKREQASRLILPTENMNGKHAFPRITG